MAAVRELGRALRLIRSRRTHPAGYRHGMSTLIALVSGLLAIRHGANLFLAWDLRRAVDPGGYDQLGYPLDWRTRYM